MKKTSSVVWQFFDRLEENKRCVAVLCKLCDVEFKYVGNTTNLSAHLRRKHPLQWDMRQTSWEQSKILDKSPLVNMTAERDLDENDEATVNSVPETLDEACSDEEWLEEEYPRRVEIFEPQIKRKKLQYTNIKRETVSPPTESAEYHRSLAAFTKSQNAAHYVIGQAHKDECSAFGEYIANKLRQLKTSRTRGNVQQLITTILWQAEYGTYDDVDSVKRMLMCAAQQSPASTSAAEHEAESSASLDSLNQTTEARDSN